MSRHLSAVDQWSGEPDKDAGLHTVKCDQCRRTSWCYWHAALDILAGVMFLHDTCSCFPCCQFGGNDNRVSFSKQGFNIWNCQLNWCPIKISSWKWVHYWKVDIRMRFRVGLWAGGCQWGSLYKWVHVCVCLSVMLHTDSINISATKWNKVATGFP